MTLRIAVTVLCVMCGVNIALFAFYVVPKLTAATQRNCERIHRLNVAGDRILDTPTNLREALDRRQITSEEYAAALHQVLMFDPLRRQNVRLWRSADCKP